MTIPCGRGPVLAAVAAMIISLAGCGPATSDSHQASPTNSPAAASTPPASTTESPTAGPTAPLTGLDVSASVTARGAVAVAVDSPAASQGVGSADVVFVEYDGHGKRLLAVFQSRPPASVGPVGQTRPADGPLLDVMHPVYAYAGGSAGFVGLLANTSLLQATPQSDPAVFRQREGTYLVNPQALQPAASKAGPPPPILVFQETGSRLAETGATNASKIQIRIPGYSTETWSYSPGSRTWSGTDPAIPAFTNLVIQIVPYKTVQLRHPDGPTAQSARVYGRGACFAASGALATACTWSKPGPGAVTNYADSTGVTLRFGTGSTAVLLAPVGSRVQVLP